MPEPNLTPDTTPDSGPSPPAPAPPIPFLVGDAAAELLREAGFSTGFRRRIAVAAISSLVLGAVAASAFFISLYRLTTKSPPYGSLDFIVPFQDFFLAAPLLTGGFLLGRLARGLHTMYTAARGNFR